MAGWIKEQYLTICCLQEMNLTNKDKHWLRIKDEKRFSKKMASKSNYEKLYLYLIK
jgi:hypothetical protein